MVSTFSATAAETAALLGRLGTEGKIEQAIQAHSRLTEMVGSLVAMSESLSVEELQRARQGAQEFTSLCSLTGRALPMAWAFPRRAGHYGRYLTMRQASASELAEWKSALVRLVSTNAVPQGDN
jgi:hypothetical protein